MTPDRALETAADYADALITARRFKHFLVLLLLLMLLAQLTIFFVARYTQVLDPLAPPAVALQPADTVLPGAVDSATGVTTTETRATHLALQYLTGGINFLGIVFIVVLALVLLLIVNVMLVGRLVGVARLTSAYIWCLILTLLLFPWQAFLAHQNFAADWTPPGILYTWNELVTFARFATTDLNFAIIKWARFVGLPAVAIVVLLAIQVKSSRGLRQALGEDTPPRDEATAFNRV
jgi:hypothetical protein